MKVAGQDLRVRVRSGGAASFVVNVDDGEPVHVARQDSPAALTRWSWWAGIKQIRATVAGHGELSVGLKAADVSAHVQDGRAAVLASLGVVQAKAKTGPLPLRTLIPGRVVKVMVSVGDPVISGQPLVVIEAMKMENETRAPRAGVVAEISVQPGAAVEAGTCLLVLAPTP